MRTLASFRDAHCGGSIVVCGCGSSLNALERPKRFVTIGVNDVGQLFDPDYLVVVDPREQFKGDRFRHIETSRAGWLFTQRDDLDLPHPNLVRFRLGEKDGTDFSDPEVLNYSVTTPYVAVCLAIHMGAANIGLIGVDFTDNHFFGPTGPHGWAPYVAAIDGQFDKLGRAAFAGGARLFNLSAQSRLTCLPKMEIDAFARLGQGAARGSERPLNIVSYATTPVVGVPAILARCITARTRHRARCVWAADTYANGLRCAGDVDWNASPARAMAELEAADVIVLHNGKTDARHRAILNEKPVVTVAHNYISNVDTSFVRLGFPGLVVGQYQATLPEFAGWSPGWLTVPNPIPLWEESFCPADKGGQIVIAYTPAGKYDAYPAGHPLYWHGKGYTATLRALDRLQARHDIRIESPRDAFVCDADAQAMKRGAHIVIDECVTGSYHRNSLEGLATGAVVVNGVGLRPGVLDALRYCAGDDEADPFVRAGLSDLEEVLERLIGLGPDLLALLGAGNRAWMEQHWQFGQQWERFWQPAMDEAIATLAARAATRRQSTPAPAAAATGP